MQRTKVESSDVRSIGWTAYDVSSKHAWQRDAGILEVEYWRGGVYQYVDVPVHVYHSVLAAKSVGKALFALVRSAGYEYKRVPDQEQDNTNKGIAS